MGGEKMCENMKSNVASLGRKLKLYLLVYIIDIELKCIKKTLGGL